MSDANRAILRLILEGPYADNVTMSAENKAVDKENFNKMKTTFNACMNEDAIKATGVAPIRKILDEFEEHFPLKAPSGVSAVDELTNAMIWLSKNKVDSLVSNFVTVSPLSTSFRLTSLR
jgi:endothelin-converting enzyme